MLQYQLSKLLERAAMISQLSVQKLQKRGTDSKVPRFFVQVFIVFMVGMLPACSKKQSKTSMNYSSMDHRSMGRSSTVQPLLTARQREAHMVDIPLPVGGVLLPELSAMADAISSHAVGSKYAPERALSTRSILTYRVATTREALVRFYEDEMMRLGWNKLAQSSGDEELLVFESPLNMAIIQMRPEKPKKGWKRNKKLILTLHETSKEN
jgi:hypothetical protein